jgi:hypothetical protein
MDVFINWFILIIIFVFDPLAVALVIAFNNALQVDRGIIDKQKVIRKRELYEEVEEEPQLPAEKKNIKLSDTDIEKSLNNMGTPLITAAEECSNFQGKPYYEHPLFDWRVKKLWQNDTKAVQYWIKNIKNKK